MSNGPSYRLVAPDPTRLAPPALDDDQQRVVDHPGGPLLVLAGPGTGKTTTLVEAIVDRIEHRGADPSSVLALTFSRKAAEQLRDRVTARLGRTLSSPISSTFHSFAYGLVRSHAPAELYAAPLRLLSAPEQDVLIQELLTGPESLTWPEPLRAAVRTRGFAAEVQAVLARAREKGLDPVDLAELGRSSGEDAYVVAASFMQRYLVVLDDMSAVDYADLIRRAVGIAEHNRDELRTRYSHVFVDEYQDTDPSQVALLQALAGDGRNLVVVGDPDQSIYGFRGADVNGILRFPSAFPATNGEPAPVVALRTTRRFGSRLLTASQTVAASIGVRGDIARSDWEAFRSPTAAPSEVGHGWVEVTTFDTARAETEHLADLLRRAHLEHDVPWSEMAVLVRSGRSTLPALRRSLSAAGVPVEVASDDTPLVREPAVMPLLAALRIVVDAGVDDPTDPRFVAVDRVEELLTSPVGGLDATDVRALARALRAREKERAAQAGETAASSRELLRRSVLDPPLLDGVGGSHGAAARRLADLLVRANTVLDGGGTAEEVLWVLWSGTDWGRRLRAATRHGGNAARFAHRDLDALCALFEAAAKAEEQRGHTSVQSFLDTLTAQEIPADTLADRGVRGDAVRLLTAHRSKGLEWRLGGRRSRAGRVMARPASSRLASPSRPDRPSRPAAAGVDRLDAGRGAAAVLRRLHAGPRAPRRDCRGLARRRGRAAVPLRPRARARSRAQGGAAAAPAVHAGTGGRAATHRRRSREARGAPAGGRVPARPSGCGRGGGPPGRTPGRSGDVVGDATPQQLRPTATAARRAGRGLREHAAVAPRLSREVVPRA